MTLRHVVVSYDPDEPGQIQVSPDDLTQISGDAAALRRAADVIESAWPDGEVEP